MRCEYCTSEPVRACLRCGSLFCKQHGELREPSRGGGQPFLNSQCQRCAETTRVQFSRFGLVFAGIGVALFVIGAMIAVISGVPAVGLIFISQGVVFGVIGLIFRMKYGSGNDRRE